MGVKHQLRGKKPAACQNDSAMRLDDAQVLGKEQVEVDNRIPFILGGSVREIAKNHIYGFGGNVLHHLKAIALNNPVAAGSNDLVSSALITFIRAP